MVKVGDIVVAKAKFLKEFGIPFRYNKFKIESINYGLGTITSLDGNFYITSIFDWKEDFVNDSEEEIEKRIVDLSADIWNEFLTLEQTHPSDIEDLSKAIHDIQKIIAVRMARRSNPSTFLTIKK
jgi:hypothetical protein